MVARFVEAQVRNPSQRTLRLVEIEERRRNEEREWRNSFLGTDFGDGVGSMCEPVRIKDREAMGLDCGSLRNFGVERKTSSVKKLLFS